MEAITSVLEYYLDNVAKFSIVCLEIIGIFFIIYGSIKALIRLIKAKLDFRDFHFKILLGESLATALQFKLGAEIIKTVLIRDTSELIIVGSIVLIRSIITFLIHWEMKQASCEI